MTGDLFAFTSDQVERLKRIVDHVESSIPSRPSQSTRPPLQSSKVFVGALESSVAGTTALLGKPKVGTFNIYTFSSTGATATGMTEICYNFAPQTATTDRWTVCERDATTNKLIITTQYCS